MHRCCSNELVFTNISFSKMGCSQWLAQQLDRGGVPESDLLWVNADEDLSFIKELSPGVVIALGEAAHVKLAYAGVQSRMVRHPQYHKRFGGGSRYPLLDLLQE